MTEHRIKADCRYYLGYKPCTFNKRTGAECSTCKFYSKWSERILIIKLDAMGDVLRTSCITPHLRSQFSTPYIVWVTRQESVPLVQCNPDVDQVWAYDLETVTRLHSEEWDAIYNLSNDHPSCALASMASLRNCTGARKVGFVLSPDGTIQPTSQAAARWLELAAFDRLKKENTRSYQEIMYEIAGIEGSIHPPRLETNAEHRQQADDLLKKLIPNRGHNRLIGINTGAGERWPRKMLRASEIVALSQLLLKQYPEAYILLLGGPLEREKHRRILNASQTSRVIDMGCDHSLLQFAALLEQCDVLVCGDTLALHMASAIGLPVVAVFGPTSAAEIYDYGGLICKITSRELDCLCCYGDCDKTRDCMNTLPLADIIDAIDRQLAVGRHA